MKLLSFNNIWAVDMYMMLLAFGCAGLVVCAQFPAYLFMSNKSAQLSAPSLFYMYGIVLQIFLTIEQFEKGPCRHLCQVNAVMCFQVFFYAQYFHNFGSFAAPQNSSAPNEGRVSDLSSRGVLAPRHPQIPVPDL